MLRRVLSQQGTLTWGNLSAPVPADSGALAANDGVIESCSGLPGDTPALGTQECVHRNPKREARGLQPCPEPRAQASECCPLCVRDLGLPLSASSESTDTCTPTALLVKCLCSPWTHQLPFVMFWRGLHGRQEPQYSIRTELGWVSKRIVRYVHQ